MDTQGGLLLGNGCLTGHTLELLHREHHDTTGLGHGGGLGNRPIRLTNHPIDTHPCLKTLESRGRWLFINLLPCVVPGEEAFRVVNDRLKETGERVGQLVL